MAQLTSIGITCGIGSLLIGARSAGFKVLGNVEWRKYYHEKDSDGRNTFLENFPGAVFPHSVEQMTEEEFRRFSNPDLALGHPECGAYSALSGANKNFRERAATDQSDIPLFVELVAKLKPRYFVMDDLPKSLTAYPMKEYADGLPEYDLYPEWVSNWGYGNVQKNRKRLFMLGALKKERWVFRPGEAEHALTVADVLGDLGKPRSRSNMPNMDPCDLSAECFRALNLGGYRKKNSWGDVKKYFADKRAGHTLQYPTKEGRLVNRIGFLKGHWDGPSHVLTGQNATLHHLRCEPYTIRERARIMGFPDDFIFYGTILNAKGEWNHDENSHMVRQTGKAMPIQFAEYVSRQIAAHIGGKPFASSGVRLLPANPHIDEAKQWYCQNVGYADQPQACGQCWLARRCQIRTRKYGLPPEGDVTPVPSRDLRPPDSKSEPKKTRTPSQVLVNKKKKHGYPDTHKTYPPLTIEEY